MEKEFDFTPTEDQFGVFWKYLMQPEVTGVNYSNGMLWITDLSRGRYPVQDVVTDKFLTQFANTIANSANKHFSSADPVLEADTRDLRISILHPSIARTGMAISLRKSPPVLRHTEESLIASGFCSREVLNLLINCVKAKLVIVFGGEPEAGKTELAKFMMQYIDPADRVITIEDSLELHYGEINPGHDCLELQVRDGFDYKAAIKASLRQDPRWLMLSEARSSEVVSLLESWSTGIAGFTTIHLDDVRKLPDRIQNMMEDKKDVERLENRIYSDVNVGVLIRMRTEADGSIRRYLDQLCFYTRENGENHMNLVVEDGRMVDGSKEFPADIMKRMREAGIIDPYRCTKGI